MNTEINETEIIEGNQEVSQNEAIAEEAEIAEASAAPLDIKKGVSGRTVGITIFSFIIAALLLAFVALYIKSDSSGYTMPSGIGLNSKPGADVYTDGERYTTQGIAKAVSPSVVGVRATGGNIIGAVSQGSGIILSKEGFIITNAHVIDGTDNQEIWLSDGRRFSAKIVGSDSKTDIAVLKIEADGLIPATLGDAEELELGEPVAALGSPMGLDGTITDGIVSGLNRKIKSDSASYRMDCIQTNAAVNPGNSGGALVNMYGQVVGIISSKYVSLDYEGIGFAISINAALPIIEELIENGYVTGRVKIGITFHQVTTYASEQFDGEVLAGLHIASVDKNCDIASTGLRKGDIIVKLDGVEVADAANVTDMLTGKKAGDEMTAEVVRPDKNGKESERFTITFKLEADVPAGK